MSIKTLRKRIALVAVSALGFGLLTATASNAVPNTPNADGEFSITTDSIVCSASQGGEPVSVEANGNLTDPLEVTDGKSLLADTAVSVVVPVNGGQLVVDVSSSGDHYAVPSGYGYVDDQDEFYPAYSLYVVDEDFEIEPSVVGSFTINIYDIDPIVSAATAKLVGRISVTTVASCGNATVSLSRSQVQVDDDYVDEPLYTAGDQLTAEAGSDLYINIAGKNSYKAFLPTGTWVASATNGATVKIGTDSTIADEATAAGLFSVTSASADGEGISVRVTPKDAAAGGTTTVTVSYNGAVVTTKTLTFLGEATKITVVANAVGKVGSSGMLWYTLQDASGKNVPGAVSVDQTTLGARIYNVTKLNSSSVESYTPSATLNNGFTTSSLGKVNYGIMEFFCADSQGSGTGTVTIRHFQPVTGAYITLPVTFTCAGGTDSFTASMDKAAYKVGEVATLTITAKDAGGNLVNDFTQVKASVTTGGGELIAPTPNSTTDLFGITNTLPTGVKTYKVQMTTAGSFNTVVTIGTKSQTVSYTVTSDGVSNTEVLAAIVKLIASINEQIALLQKQLKKMSKKK